MRLIRILLALAALALPAPAGATDLETARELLARPGVHAIMRHALAPGGGDPPGFRLGACETQRNLDDRGRAQARAVGDALRAAGAAFDRVLTSQWCRCRETAELLGLGAPEAFPALNSFFSDRSTAGAQTAELRAFLAGLPADRRVMLVTHQVNITALTGRGVSSGEVFLIEVGADGAVEVVGEVYLRP